MVKLVGSNWHVVAKIDLDKVEQQSKSIIYGISLIIFLFLLLSTFLIMKVQKNVVWRLRKLGARMHDISFGEFNVIVSRKSNDEIGELENHFNIMSTRLGKLVNDISDSKMKEREQSFRALQAQINPHFIYNSLSLLRWRALDMQDEEQIRTIDALTTFYRFALNNKVNITCIRNEIEHVQAYLFHTSASQSR